MKIRLLFAFIRWIFSKIVSNVSDANTQFRRSLRRETGLALFAWLILTVIFMTVITAIGSVTFIDTAEQLGWFVLAQFVISVLYLVVNGVTIMYEAFERDRQELFNILKDPR
jgi:succinate dehydrogenase/fumarate reductase cytochrome b subunit